MSAPANVHGGEIVAEPKAMGSARNSVLHDPAGASSAVRQKRN